MKQLNATIGKIIFYLFVLAVFGWTASLTLGEMKAILPNDPITPYFALALFDGGALAWLMAWIGHARGLMQRAISAIMLVVCLAGVVLLSAGRLMEGGQTMVTASASLSAAVIYGVIGATLANLAAIYAFHVSDPDTMEEIETGLLSDTLRTEAQKQASASIEGQAKELGAILAARATGQLKYNLRLPMGIEEIAQANNFIDATARDVEAQPIQKMPGVLEAWMKAAADKFKRSPVTITQPAKVYQAVTTAPAVVTDAKSGSLYDAMKQGIAEAQGTTADKLYSPADGIARVLSQVDDQPEAPHYHPMGGLQPMTEPKSQADAPKGDGVFPGGVAGGE